MVDKIEQNYEDMKDTVQKGAAEARENVANATKDLEGWLSANPWKNMTIGIAVGYILNKII